MQQSTALSYICILSNTRNNPSKILSIQVNHTLQSTNTDQNYICLTSFSGKPPKLIFGTTAQNTFLTQHLIVDHSSHTTTCSLCRKCNLYEETK